MTRTTLDEIKTRMTPDRIADFRRRADAVTEENVRCWAAEEGDDADTPVPIERVISPSVIRKRLGLSQPQFAQALGVPVGTLRNWEQHRTSMEPSAVALMILVANDPEGALRTLRRAHGYAA
jgi:putative transcriptional regulator